MDVVLTRTFLYVVFPVALGVGLILWDSSTAGRLRRSEALLIPLFVVGVAGSGIGGFVAHVFISERLAESIGWPSGNPFQLEVGFANLAIGLLGAIAAGRRDGFREATVIAVTVFGVGATIVHVVDILQSGNLAPGNTAQNGSNLIRPALLIALMVVSRRAQQDVTGSSELMSFDLWREPIVQASVVAVVVVSSAFAAGFATGQTVTASALGTVGASLAFAGVIVKARRQA